MVSIGTRLYIFGGAQWIALEQVWRNTSNEVFIFDTRKFELNEY